ncbi:hypothetical protein DMENIID0001_030860 [Sergentomyia squamirostris]
MRGKIVECISNRPKLLDIIAHYHTIDGNLLTWPPLGASPASLARCTHPPPPAAVHLVQAIIVLCEN